jgi:serine protease Do
MGDYIFMNSYKLFVIIASLLVLTMIFPSCSLLSLPAITETGIPQNNTSTTTTSNNAVEPIDPTYTAPTPSGTSTPSEMPDFVSVISEVRPSVVSINTKVTSLSVFGGLYTQEGAGSGWIIDDSGLIVTNNHVVENADSISVTFEDGRNFTAETVRADPVSDLAVIKIEADNLPPALSIYDSTSLEVGEWVIAIGNSLGQGISATKGIISALGVSITSNTGETLYDLIQTDAAINPGNSGGPLINMSGKVIGINSVKVAQVGVEGMGYAISTHTAMPIIDELIKYGYVKRPWMGASLYTVDQTAIRQLGLSVNEGVLLVQVLEGGPSDKAGLQRFDVITQVNGEKIVRDQELVNIIRSSQIGDTLEITYWRDNSSYTTELTLEQSPPPSSQS